MNPEHPEKPAVQKFVTASFVMVLLSALLLVMLGDTVEQVSSKLFKKMPTSLLVSVFCMICIPVTSGSPQPPKRRIPPEEATLPPVYALPETTLPRASPPAPRENWMPFCAMYGTRPSPVIVL